MVGKCLDALFNVVLAFAFVELACDWLNKRDELVDLRLQLDSQKYIQSAQKQTIASLQQALQERQLSEGGTSTYYKKPRLQ